MNRKQRMEKRAQITDRPAKDELLEGSLLPFFETGKRIGTYAPIRFEADGYTPFASRKNLVLPKVTSETEIQFFAADHLGKGAFGVMEPAASQEIVPELLVIPMLSFDGPYRMGYGKGYYDRYLQKHPECLRIGIAYDEQEEPFQISPWDQPLDLIVTPTRILDFRREPFREAEWLELILTQIRKERI